MTNKNRCYRLIKRPEGKLLRSDLLLVDEDVAELSQGQVLVQTLVVSIDPTNRIWMSDRAQYMEPIALGDVVRAIGIGKVVQSTDSRFSKDQLVSGLLGWQTLGVHSASSLQLLPDLPVPLNSWLSTFGMTSLTAYFGLTKIGVPKAADTVVVSGAAGAVGSVAGQIAKNLSCKRVVGIVGSAAKARTLVEEFGFDAAVNYNDSDFTNLLTNACPQGIDVYFENVGGKVLEAVIPLLNNFARIPLCGLISQYNLTSKIPGPTGFEMLLMRRVKLQGFIVSDYFSEFEPATRQLVQWWQEGKLRTKETVVQGFEKLPDALNMIFEGQNTGKLMLSLL